jgi:hypothetical protein
MTILRRLGPEQDSAPPPSRLRGILSLLGAALAWSVGGLVVLIPVAVIAADRLLPWGGLAALAWGPPLVGVLAGLAHGDWRLGVSAGLGVLVLGVVAFAVMVVLALRSLPGP